MATKEEVIVFLTEFKEKMNIWDVLFRDDRGKNTQTLADLELRPIERKEVLKNLNVEDYADGPLEEMLYGGADMWIFGEMINNSEVYIKITKGIRGSNVLCISFHIVEYKLEYPFKK